MAKSKKPNQSLPHRTTPNPRPKGRPKLEDGQKGTYRHLLVPERELKIVNYYAKNPVVQAGQVFTLVDEILANPTSANYYWRLVYSYAFSTLKESKKKLSTVPYRLSTAATESGLKGFHMKRIVRGDGHAELTQRFIGFFYQHAIDVQAIRFNPAIIAAVHRQHVQLVTH